MSGPTSASGTPALSWTPATTPGAYNYRNLNAGETASQVFALTCSRHVRGYEKVALAQLS